MGRGNLRRLAVAAGGIGLVAVVAASTATARPERHVLPGAKPAWTSDVQQTGTLAHVAAKVWLAPRNADQLTALAQSVSDPASAQYQQFISPAQYRAEFAPTAAQVGAVRDWLTSAGLTIDGVGPDAHYIAVDGAAAAVKSAFGTDVGTFSVNGKSEHAPVDDVSVPDAVASSVLAVSGLTSLGHRVHTEDLGAPDAFVNSTPCSSYYGQKVASDLPAFQGAHVPYAVCGYTPSQLRGVYGVPSGLGSGQTVAITDAFDASVLESDANTYASRHGEPAFRSGQFSDRSVPEATDSRVTDCGGNSWYGEQTLDIEAVHGMATAANVAYYGAASCYDDDLLAQLSQIVSDGDASIVTNSWGENTYYIGPKHKVYSTVDPTLVDAYETVFKQGAAEGIGFYFSSGDFGDELANTGVKFPDYPAEDPWVTAVGGTSVAIGSSNQRLFETGWGTAKWTLSTNGNRWQSAIPFQYGAGGGDAAGLFDRPSYQIGIVQDGSTGRAVPDIGLDADPTTGMLVGETQSFTLPSAFGPAGVHYGEYRIGGTSLASPLMAGVAAAYQQSHGRIGFANPWLYALGAGGAFYDVTPQGDAGNARVDFANGQNADGGLLYSVRTFDQDSSLTTGPGWDNVSGLGSVVFRNLKPAR